MATLPKKAIKDVFTASIDGVYGRFKTARSFELDYLMASFRVNRLRDLETAAEALDFQAITFDELMQRDVDYDRVDNEIIEGYLEKDEGKVIFFPPLLVTLLSVENGKPIEKYSSVVDEIKKDKNDNPILLTRIWGGDKFKVEINLTEENTGYQITSEGKIYNYIHYAVTVKYNPEVVKLVVIDGQHRFEALRRIHSDPSKKEHIADVQVPICLFFSPDAVVNAESEETIKVDVRELFITINQKSKEVSGHFLDLLKDNSLASLSVRDIANLWKGDDKSALSILPMLEWNTREARRAHQRQSDISITTISIIAEALRKYVFEKRSGGLTKIILNLSAIPKFEELNGPDISSIEESTFSLDQAPILRKQISRYITPAIDVLLTKPRPYKELIDLYKGQVQALDERISKGSTSAATYKEDILYQFRSCKSNDSDSIKTEENDFLAPFESASQANEDRFYFLNIFQQALFRSWAELCKKLIKYEIEPKFIAESMVDSFELICFDEKKMMFSPHKNYMQILIYKKESTAVNVSKIVKEGLSNLMLSTFIKEDVLNSFVNKIVDLADISDITELKADVIELSKKCKASYFVEYIRAIKTDISDNWQYKDYDMQIKTYLMEKQNSDAEAQKEFDVKIDELSEDRISLAKDEYSNLLSLATNELFS